MGARRLCLRTATSHATATRNATLEPGGTTATRRPAGSADGRRTFTLALARSPGRRDVCPTLGGARSRRGGKVCSHNAGRSKLEEFRRDAARVALQDRHGAGELETRLASIARIEKERATNHFLKRL